MLTKFLIILDLAIFINIGLYYKPFIQKETNPRLAPYYNEVLDIIKSKCDSKEYNSTSQYRLTFKRLSNPNVGVCTRYHIEYEINMDELYWNEASQELRFQLMAHEMMHCLFHLPHVQDPNNFMNPELQYLTKEETTKQIYDILKEKCIGGHK